jgi:hypothetical protein
MDFRFVVPSLGRKEARVIPDGDFPIWIQRKRGNEMALCISGSPILRQKICKNCVGQRWIGGINQGLLK